jgi:hypothetical protein
MEWISIEDRFPEIHDQEILFIAKEGITHERIGIAIPSFRYILLKNTDISFDEITHWMPIPSFPLSKKQEV